MPPRILGPLFAVLLCATAALAQVNYAPTPPPETSAAGRSWYLNKEPIFFAGDLYYPAGPTVYFNGETMVPTGSYDGVTLYADTTIEPYSVVFVPIGDSLLRQYERPRTGNLAGTSGSRLSSLPPQVGRYSDQVARPEAAEQRAPRGQRRRPGRVPQAPPPEVTPPLEEAPGGLLVQTARRPQDNLGIWVLFQGYRWEQSGEAVPLDPARLTRVGEYYGFPVYADARAPYVVYLPLRANLVTPFRRSAP